MLRALLKAFTGRAGLLASVLALLIISVIALAGVMGVDRIEQKVTSVAQTYLKANMLEGETLTKIHAEGRDVHLQGQWQDVEALRSGLGSVEGVRQVYVSQSQNSEIEQLTDSIDSTDTSEQTTVSDVAQQLTGVESKLTDVEPVELVKKPSSDDQTTQNEAPASELKVVESEPDVDSDKVIDQSSLTLRYDGKQLLLKGHVAGEQMAELVAQEVSEVVPNGSTLTSEIKANGKVSALNWMATFLDIVAGLPDDAQGIIQGSDKSGVLIKPDAEQTLMQTQTAPAKSDLSEQMGNNSQVNANGSSGLSVGFSMSQSAESSFGTATNIADQNNAEAAKDALSMEADIKAANVGDNTVEVAVNTDADDIQVETYSSESVQQQSEPANFILSLNKRLASQTLYNPGEIQISAALAQELDGLVDLMYRYPSLLLRVVGNIDFKVDPRDAEYVGIDRAREIRGYIRANGVEPFRVFAAPLPRDYAFDERVQIVFYVSE